MNKPTSWPRYLTLSRLLYYNHFLTEISWKRFITNISSKPLYTSHHRIQLLRKPKDRCIVIQTVSRILNVINHIQISNDFLWDSPFTKNIITLNILLLLFDKRNIIHIMQAGLSEMSTLPCFDNLTFTLSYVHIICHLVQWIRNYANICNIFSI